MSHEQSETIRREDGKWINVYGKNTPKAGQQLPGTPTFDTVDDAVVAARGRSAAHGAAPGLDSLATAYQERRRRQDDAEWQALLNSAPAPVENTPPDAPAPKSKTPSVDREPGGEMLPKPQNAAVEGAGAVVAGAVVAGQALYAGGKSALTDPMGFLKAVGDGAWDGGTAAVEMAVPGAQKMLGGLWSQFSKGPSRAGAADLVEGVFEVAAAPFVGVGTWAQTAYEKLAPGERERIVLPGGRGSAASTIRRVFNLPFAVAEGIRSGKTDLTEAQEESFDAPMTAGELLNIVAALNGPKALSSARRALPKDIAGVEKAAKGKVDAALSNASQASAKAEGAARKLEGLVKEVTEDRQPWIGGVKTVVAEAGAEFVKVTEEGGKRVVEYRDPVTGKTGEMPLDKLSKHNLQAELGTARSAEASGGLLPEQVREKLKALEEQGKKGSDEYKTLLDELGPEGEAFKREAAGKKPITPEAESAPTTEAQARQFVEKAGGDFVGFTEITKAPGAGAGVDKYVWFNDKTFGTTMLLKAEDATVSGITKHIAEKTEEFRAAREGVTTETLTKLGVEPGRAAEIAARVAEQKPLTPSLEGPYQPNYNYIQASAETKHMMRRVYETLTSRIAEKRGKGSFDAIDAEASRLLSSGEVTIEKLLDTPPSAEPVAGAKLRAYRMLEVGVADFASEAKDRTLNGTAAPGELRRAIALSQEVSERVYLAKNGVGQALNSLKDPVEGALGRITPEALARVADQIDPRVTDLELAHAFNIAEKVEGRKGAGRLARFVHHFPDAFMELFYGSVLWGKAIGRNFIGNLAMEPFPNAITAIAPYMPKGLMFVTPKEARLRPGVVPGEAAARLHGHIEGWTKNTIAKARLAAVEEAGGGKFRLLADTIEPAIAAHNLGLEGLGPLSAAVDYLGVGLRGSSRILEKNDVWTKSHVINAELHAMAHRRATVEGLTGERFMERYRELVDDPTRFPKSDRAELARRVKQDTFTHEIENPVFRAFAEAMDRIPVASAAIRFFVLAFPKITSNMFETFASYTPILNAASTRFWVEMRAGGARAQMAYARLTLGAAIYTTVFAWADEGIITGDLPTDPVLRAQALKREDYQERSLNLGGRWVSFRGLGFMEDILAAGANFRHAITQIPSPDMPKVALALGLSMYDTVDNMAFINTFGQFASILSQAKSPEKRVDDIEKFFQQKVLALVPFSGGLRELRRTVDPVQRETKAFMQKFNDMIPGLSDLKDKDGNFLNPPRRDMLTGEPQGLWNVPLVPGQSKIAKHDDVWEEVWRLGGAGLRPVQDFVVPGMDDDEAFGLSPNVLQKTGVRLTPQEVDRWVELQTQVIKQHGMTMHEQMAHMIASARYQKQSDATKASILQNLYTGYRDAAKGLLIKESPLLQREVNRARAEDAIKQLPPDRQPAARDALRRRIGIAP